ncbi:hypothetical protein D9M68_440040 [compost metagenome]
MSTPTWFLEGDAVAIETSLTEAGRGRQPSWIMPFRTALLEGRTFSYSKAYFGSGKDITPGYYQLGYLLRTRLTNEYGEDAVNSLFNEIRKNPLRPYPFSRSLKKITGYNTRQWYLYNIEKLQKEWENQDRLNPGKTYISLNAPSKQATDYLLPQTFSEHEIICLKQSKAIPPTLILLNTKTQEEKKLFTIGYQEQPWFSYANSLLVWTETRYDPRYKQRSYNVICSYNFITRQKKQLTFKSRLFSPSLSADGKKLIAVTIDLSNQANLIALDPQSGKTLMMYANPEHHMLQTPALNADGSDLTWVSVSETGKALWIKWGNEIPEKIIPETRQQLSRPLFNGTQIIFNAHLNGIDNIFEVNPVSKKIMALSASKYGAFNAAITDGGKELLFNDFQITGHQVVRTPLTTMEIQPDHFVYYGTKSAGNNKDTNVFTNIPVQSYPSGPYHPFHHLFNFHSLSPAINNSETAGLYLRSTDLLDYAGTYAGISYNSRLRKIDYETGFTFKALYPIFSTNFKNRAATAFYKSKSDSSIRKANWRENDIDLHVSLPLSITRYSHNYLFSAEAGTRYVRRNLNRFDAGTIATTVKFPINYLLGFTHVVRAAERDISPRFAQTFNIQYFHLPFDANTKGKLFAFQSGFYFPGIAQNHSFSASFNYQKATGVLQANTEIQTVFGYEQIQAKSVLNNSLLFNYRFPIGFPDAEVGSLAYIRNIRGGLFVHYENIGTETNLSRPKTYGFELRSSMNLLRYQPLVDLGARVIFVNRSYQQNPILDLIFNYSF